VVVRRALGYLSAALGIMLAIPSLMFLVVQMRGFDFSDSSLVRTVLPLQLGLAAILLLISFILLRGGRKTS